MALLDFMAGSERDEMLVKFEDKKKILCTSNQVKLLKDVKI